MHAPQPRTRNPCQVSHVHGLASSAFARHYSRNHNCFLVLRVLRCFTSPRYLPLAIYSPAGDATSLAPGFPIRTSSDQRSVDSSPRHNAASHVLHRLSMPRHPPCALKHLQHKKPKINELKNSEIAHQHTKSARPHKGTDTTCVLDARNHYPQIKHHTPPPKMKRQPVLSPVSHTRDEEIAGLLSQSPIVCPMIPRRRRFPTNSPTFVVAPEPHPTTGPAHLTNRPGHRTPTHCGRANGS